MGCMCDGRLDFDLIVETLLQHYGVLSAVMSICKKESPSTFKLKLTAPLDHRRDKYLRDEPVEGLLVNPSTALSRPVEAGQRCVRKICRYVFNWNNHQRNERVPIGEDYRLKVDVHDLVVLTTVVIKAVYHARKSLLPENCLFSASLRRNTAVPFARTELQVSCSRETKEFSYSCSSCQINLNNARLSIIC